ncbi:MAG: hypothetical protein WD669_08150 [Pirellulales bacterium]
MASKSSDRRKKQPGVGQPCPAPAQSGATVGARKRAGEDAWELVHPRCARDRADDLDEVRKMIEAGELDVAIDECRWLLQGCSDCLEAHRILGEIALGENDLPLARGHFGYAYRLGTQALAQARCKGPLPYRLAANRGFHESGKALAWCLMQLGKAEMAAEVVELLLACDPGDPLCVRNLLASDGR